MVASYDYTQGVPGAQATGGFTAPPQQMGWTNTSYRKTPTGGSTPVEWGYYPGQPQQPQPGGGGGQGGYGQQPGGYPGGGGQPGSGSGGGHYGGGGTGGVTPPGTTTPPQTGSGTATGPLYTKADTDRRVSQTAAAAFGQGDAYSAKIAASGNGMSYGAGQASQINPLVAQAGVNARTAAKVIPMQDAMANESWMLGNQVQQGRNALDWARLGEYDYQTQQMGSDFFTKLLMAML